MSWHHELAAFCVWHCQLFPGALATRSAYPLPANVAEEPRPAAHKCKPGEVELDQRYFGRQPGEAELEDSDPGGGSDGGGGVVASDSDDDVADAGALDDGSDSGGHPCLCAPAVGQACLPCWLACELGPLAPAPPPPPPPGRRGVRGRRVRFLRRAAWAQAQARRGRV
jgi:hypothetical protein